MGGRAFAVAFAALAPLVASPGESACERDVRFALERLEKECGAFFERKKIDWPAVSKRLLADAKKVKNEEEHLLLLVRLLARLRDGHAEVRPLEAGRNVRLPDEERRERVEPGMSWCRIGDAIVVKNAWGEAAEAGIEPGSTILKVDGRPVAAWLEERIATLSDTRSFSTDHQAFFFACRGGLEEPRGAKHEFEWKSPKGKTAKREVKYGPRSGPPPGPAVPPEDLRGSPDVRYGRTASGFGYVHLRRCREELPAQIDEALAAIGAVPGLILDFRGNGGGGFDHDAFMGRFVPAGRTIEFGSRYASAGATPYGGPIVAIVDATVVSAGETGVGIFKEDGRGYLIGESPTAGMSSQKTTIELPSGLFALYVSVRSNKHRFNGGKGIEGIGVVPHELVPYDAGDLAAKKDTLIARAEALLRAFPKGKVPYDPVAFGWKPDGAATR